MSNPDHDLAALLAGLSAHLDAQTAKASKVASIRTWMRITRCHTQAGAVINTHSATLGQNGHDRDTIAAALTAAVESLAVVEHLTGNKGDALYLLGKKIRSVAATEGVTATTGDGT